MIPAQLGGLVIRMLPPVLEIYVVHHREDKVGAKFAGEVFTHFHGNTFSGLIGGAVEVFVRSSSWDVGSEAPRPVIRPRETGPNGVVSAQIVAIVPVSSFPLARAVEAGGAWAAYLEELVRYQKADSSRIGLFPLSVDDAVSSGGRLADLLGSYQRIGMPSGLSDPEPLEELRCRDLAQGITQMILGPTSRLQVFVSHTQRLGDGEEDFRPLIRIIREIIGETRLRHFFDASDLQPGRDWDETLRINAAHSALLALRTDLYASRAWCQREMLIAKQAGMPIVILDSLGHGEERGSFLMDHLPRIPARMVDGQWSKSDIRRALNLLVDESLKRAVWEIQKELARDKSELQISWWAPHAPEPITLIHWLAEVSAHPDSAISTGALRIIHPDPPLGPDEQQSLSQILQLAGYRGACEVTTPRALAARGA